MTSPPRDSAYVSRRKVLDQLQLEMLALADASTSSLQVCSMVTVYSLQYVGM